MTALLFIRYFGQKGRFKNDMHVQIKYIYQFKTFSGYLDFYWNIIMLDAFLMLWFSSFQTDDFRD